MTGSQQKPLLTGRLEMNHEHYVLAAYLLTFVVMVTATLKVWFSGRRYRRRIEALARRRHPRGDR
ncbi:heme exporter protein CcmD [Rhizobium sp. IY2]|uniref:heme exporter protein CcmD n=1 Tax=Rhizobium sp. IY2 TaxID=3397853 RepID=UPI0039DFE087